jgi:effector-binding domain-containing protein
MRPVLETPTITDSAAQHAAVIHFTIPRAEIRHVMGPAFQELAAAVTAEGTVPAGPPFSHHFRQDPEVFDFAVGLPVAAPVRARGRVRRGELPATRVARAVYRGGYEGLAAAWAEFGAWLAAHGYQAGPELWECYVTGPEASADPAQWRTELNRPLIV